MSNINFGGGLFKEMRVEIDSYAPDRKVIWIPKNHLWDRVSSHPRPTIAADENVLWTEVSIQSYREQRRSFLQKITGKGKEDAILGPDEKLFEDVAGERRLAFLVWLSEAQIDADKEFHDRFSRTGATLKKIGPSAALLEGVEPMPIHAYKLGEYFKTRVARLPQSDVKEKNSVDINLFAEKIKTALQNDGEVIADVNPSNATRLALFIRINHGEPVMIKSMRANPDHAGLFIAHQNAICRSHKIATAIAGHENVWYFPEDFRPDASLTLPEEQEHILRSEEKLLSLEATLQLAEQQNTVARDLFANMQPEQFHSIGGFARYYHQSVISSTAITNRIHGISVMEASVDDWIAEYEKLMTGWVQNPQTARSKFDEWFGNKLLERNKITNSYVVQAMASLIGYGQLGICTLGAEHFRGKIDNRQSKNFFIEQYLDQIGIAEDMRAIIFDPLCLSELSKRIKPLI